MSHPLSAVRTRRTILGVTAVTIAKRLAMEPNSYGRMERGERRCFIDKAIVLSHLLECSVEQLGIEPTGEEKMKLYKRNVSATAMDVSPLDKNPLDAWPDDDQPEQLNDLTVPPARGTVVTHTPVETQIVEAQSTYTPPNLDDPAVMAALVADWSDIDDDDTVD